LYKYPLQQNHHQKSKLLSAEYRKSLKVKIFGQSHFTMKKQPSSTYIFSILVTFWMILLTACGEPEPLTQERLDNLNCHPGDLPKNQTYTSIDGRPHSLDIFFAGAPTLVSTLAYNDVASTRQSFSCTIFAFADEQTAQRGFDSACDELTPPFHYPAIGDQACRGGEQEVNLIFRKGTFVVWIWADLNGKGIEDTADRVAERLNP
jgi:hypothetical protein